MRFSCLYKSTHQCKSYFIQWIKSFILFLVIYSIVIIFLFFNSRSFTICYQNNLFDEQKVVKINYSSIILKFSIDPNFDYCVSEHHQPSNGRPVYNEMRLEDFWSYLPYLTTVGKCNYWRQTAFNNKRASKLWRKTFDPPPPTIAR